MKKLKKSAKAIIISIVAVVCVLAIVLGCVFGLKKSSPSNPAGQQATALQKFENYINNGYDNPEY